MKKLIACALFAFAACSHDTPPAQHPGSETASADDDDATVDPTLPSWAPHSCKRYHAAVIRLAGCAEVTQDVRDHVTTKYDADTKAWHDMTNATQADLDEVGTTCGDQATAVRAQITAGCAKSNPEQRAQAET